MKTIHNSRLTIHNWLRSAGRRLLLVMALFTVHSSLFVSGAQAQTIGDAFYIYRNDGQFNAFFRDEVDSIAYSYYDADSIRYDEIVTQLVYTPDSLYRIPIAAIDSVGFVTPETIYKDDAVPLTGGLFDYLIKADSLTLTFDTSLPDELMPHVGDKLVATEISDKLPYGFAARVNHVSFSFAGIEVSCDSIGLADAVSRFYGVYEIGVADNGEVRARGPRRARTTTVSDYGLPFGRTQLPPIDVSIFIREKNTFDINYKNTLDIAFTPQIHIKVTRVVDDLAFRSHTNIYAVTNVDVETGLDISGEAAKDWKKSFLPRQDFIIPPCIPFYFDIGMKLSLSGEIATGFTINSHVRQITDITYYDVSLIPLVGSVLSPIVNRVDGSVDITTMDMTWNYLGLRAELKPCVYMRVGIPAVTHVAGWVGGEFDGGVKVNGELMFDFNRLLQAEPSTVVYDELKDMAKIDIKPYVGAHFMAAAVDDKYTFRMGEDFENPKWTWYQGRILPGFSDTEAKPLSGGRAQVTANITNDCFIPYTVGFALYDENGHHVKTELNEEKYWTRHAFPSYQCEFTDLATDKKYKVYPVIRFFGKYDMLCSPSADLDMEFPVELSDFEVTKSQYQKNGFSYGGRSYDYRFDVSVKATLDDDADGIADWGYAYLDPNGNEALISLRQFGTQYTDTRYVYYRNEAHSTATLYGYVKYVGSDEPVYGEPHDYPLDYEGEHLCPDENHPHMIDLGLPSGTKWACCNIGASYPDASGDRYAWGETEVKSDYTASNYQFAVPSADSHMSIDGVYYDFVYIGEDICGTNYDVAHVKWDNSWRMPSVTEMEELVSQCTWQQDDYNYTVTGPNGASIVLPGYWQRYWTGNLNHWASYWGTLYNPVPYVLWLEPSPHVHSPTETSTGTSRELGYFTAAYSGCYVRPVSDSNILATRQMVMKNNAKVKSIAQEPVNNIIIVANEEIESTTQGQRTLTKLIHK